MRSLPGTWSLATTGAPGVGRSWGGSGRRNVGGFGGTAHVCNVFQLPKLWILGTCRVIVLCRVSHVSHRHARHSMCDPASSLIIVLLKDRVQVGERGLFKLT